MNSSKKDCGWFYLTYDCDMADPKRFPFKIVAKLRNGTEIGHAFVYHSVGLNSKGVEFPKCFVRGIEVDGKYQRKGIVFAIYEWASALTGKPANRSMSRIQRPYQVTPTDQTVSDEEAVVQPIKRGRGRPRKEPTSVSVPIVKQVKMGRPKKRRAKEKISGFDALVESIEQDHRKKTRKRLDELEKRLELLDYKLELKIENMNVDVKWIKNIFAHIAKYFEDFRR